jgi:hypothetical protein
MTSSIESGADSLEASGCIATSGSLGSTLFPDAALPRHLITWPGLVKADARCISRMGGKSRSTSETDSTLSDSVSTSGGGPDTSVPPAQCDHCDSRLAPCVNPQERVYRLVDEPGDNPRPQAVGRR